MISGGECKVWRSLWSFLISHSFCNLHSLSHVQIFSLSSSSQHVCFVFFSLCEHGDKIHIETKQHIYCCLCHWHRFHSDGIQITKGRIIPRIRTTTYPWDRKLRKWKMALALTFSYIATWIPLSVAVDLSLCQWSERGFTFELCKKPQGNNAHKANILCLHKPLADSKLENIPCGQFCDKWAGNASEITSQLHVIIKLYLSWLRVYFMSSGFGPGKWYR